MTKLEQLSKQTNRTSNGWYFLGWGFLFAAAIFTWPHVKAAVFGEPTLVNPWGYGFLVGGLAVSGIAMLLLSCLYEVISELASAIEEKREDKQ